MASINQLLEPDKYHNVFDLNFNLEVKAVGFSVFEEEWRQLCNKVFRLAPSKTILYAPRQCRRISVYTEFLNIRRRVGS